MGNRETAKQFYNAAAAALGEKTSANLQTAYQLFSSAVVADPTWAESQYQLGNNNSDLKCPHAAIACWRRALECGLDDDMRGKLLVNLGWQLHFLGKDEEALAVTTEALKINDKLVLGWHNMALIHGQLDDSEKQIAAARKAYELDPNDVHTPIGLAFALLFAGQYEEGFKHFEQRFKWRLHHFLHYPYPKWQGERDKTVFLVADQGLGDTLSFSRFVPHAAKRAKFIHAVVQPALMRAFTYAFADLPNVNVVPLNTTFLPADVWSTFVSLPYALGLTDEEVRNQPPLKFPQFQMHDLSWKVPDRRLHIGVAWAGSPLNDIDKDRNIPVTEFLELYRIPGIQLYSLQVGDKGKEAREAGAAALMVDLTGYIQDVIDTISLLPHLDLVITCESALGHICNAVNFPSWVPYSWLGRDYRAGHTGENPLWGAKQKFFRQGRDMRWGPVFERIIKELRKL